MRLSLRLSGLALAAAAPLAVATPVVAQTQAPTIFVIDGSGSMWGNLATERASKFDLARTTLRLALATSPPDARLGLLSYGHRRKADCSDVEVIAPPDPGPAERILTFIDKLNPKGKGPLALALREAAKLVGPDSPGTIILIHDGPDNCQQDPCAAAAEIAKSNPGLAVHVVGLALEKADIQRMSCVANATKGKLFDARDALTLTTSIAEAVKLANLVTEPLSAQVGRGPSATSPDSGAAEKPVGPPGLRLSAALTANGAALALPIAWRVAKSESPDETLIERTAAELSENLPPGSYVVDASLGAAKAHQKVDVAAEGPTSVRIDLNAGTLKFAARASKTGDPIASPTLTISRAPDEAGARGLTEPVWMGLDPDAEVVLPAGAYVARVEEGLASREASVTVSPGSRSDAQLVLGTGSLELSAVTQPGASPLAQVTFTVSEDDPESPGGRREIARSADPNARFSLPAGTYYVTATAGAAEARDRIAIGTGDVVKHDVVLNVGHAILSAQLDGAAPTQDQPIDFRVLRLDASPREVFRSTGTAAELLLTPARYRFEARHGAQNVRAAVEVDLTAGKEYKITLKLESAELTVKSEGNAGRGSEWEVRDSQGKTVMRSRLGGSRTARLAPGRYVLRSLASAGTSERPFDLKPQERRTIDAYAE